MADFKVTREEQATSRTKDILWSLLDLLGSILLVFGCIVLSIVCVAAVMGLAIGSGLLLFYHKVLAPRPGTLDWQRQRPEDCDVANAEAFWPKKGGSSLAAKRICAPCPVRAQCLRYALENHEDQGVWGGTGERDRRELRKTFRDLSDEELLALTALPVRQLPEQPKLSESLPSEPMPALPVGSNEKQCRDCWKVKPTMEFSARAQSPDGLDNYCTRCKAARAHEYYAGLSYESRQRRRQERRAS